jgi:hypothetical protein
MPNLSTFLGSFPGGFQRTNRFLCKLDVSQISGANPTGDGTLQALYPEAIVLLRQGLLCSTISLPNRTFESTELDIYGYQQKYPVGVQYGDMECTFMAPLVRNVNVVHQFFTAWHFFIQNHSVRRSGDLVLRFPDEYRVKDGMTIELIDTSKNGLPSYADYWITNKIRLYNVYPMNVNSSQLDWGAQDELMSVPITFSYTSWENVPANS